MILDQQEKLEEETGNRELRVSFLVMLTYYTTL